MGLRRCWISGKNDTHIFSDEWHVGRMVMSKVNYGMRDCLSFSDMMDATQNIELQTKGFNFKRMRIIAMNASSKLTPQSVCILHV